MSRICQITVNSPLVAPALKAKEAFSWVGQLSQVGLLPVENSMVNIQDENDSQGLSLEMFGRPKVLSILAHAFSHGLTRDCAWNLDQIKEDDLECYLMAAKVYKRGVVAVKNQTVHQTQVTRIGAPETYPIDFVSNIEDCFVAHASSDLIIVDQQVVNYFSNKLPTQALVFEFSEANKNIHLLAQLISQIRKHENLIGHKSFVIHVVGGGVAGDIVGMAAGLMGVKVHYIPTTLLAMVDSSVGGKVAVNFEPWGKNQIGLFHNPVGVSICQEWLNTLPTREFQSGLAEALKHALLLGDLELWRKILDCSKAGPESLSIEILKKVVQVKVDIVSLDPREMGERVVLNLGHTLGHVIESMALKENQKIPHGQCVAVGMLHALRLSKKYFGMQEADGFIHGLLQSEVLPNKELLMALWGASSDFEKMRDEVVGLLLADKKSKADNTVRFILLKDLGQIARGTDRGWTISFKPDDAWDDIRRTFNDLFGVMGV